MKKSKGISLILIIPLVVATLLIVGVFAYKLYSEGSVRTKAAGAPVNKVNPALQPVSGKPSTGYGAIKGPTPKATPTPSSLDLETILNATDDDAKLDLDAIDASASQL